MIMETITIPGTHQEKILSWLVNKRRKKIEKFYNNKLRVELGISFNKKPKI